MSASEEITQRYNKVERELDALGRTIGVKRLKPSQQIKLQGMTPDLDGESEQVDKASGKTIAVSNRAPAFIAASVVEIDGAPIPFPKTRAELDSMLDALDSEGLEAAATAMARLMGGEEQGGIDAAKNSRAIQTSGNDSGS